MAGEWLSVLALAAAAALVGERLARSFPAPAHPAQPWLRAAFPTVAVVIVVLGTVVMPARQRAAADARGLAIDRAALERLVAASPTPPLILDEVRHDLLRQDRRFSDLLDLGPGGPALRPAPAGEPPMPPVGIARAALRQQRPIILAVRPGRWRLNGAQSEQQVLELLAPLGRVVRLEGDYALILPANS